MPLSAMCRIMHAMHPGAQHCDESVVVQYAEISSNWPKLSHMLHEQIVRMATSAASYRADLSIGVNGIVTNNGILIQFQTTDGENQELCPAPKLGKADCEWGHNDEL